MEIEYYEITLGSRVNGPGVRNVLHTQGCNIKCKGCFNTHTWAKGGGTVSSVEDVQSKLFIGNPEGITISGGEPTEQWKPVSKILSTARKRNISTLVFTGRTEEELRKMGIWDDFEALVDIVVLGPFDREKKIKEPLRSSDNQRVRYLSERHSPEDIEDIPEVEIHIDGDEIKIAGFPTHKTKTSLLRTIRG